MRDDSVPITNLAHKANNTLCVATTSCSECTIHEQVKIDRETGALLCRNCAKGRDYASKVVEAWPVQLASWLRTHQPDRPLAPAHIAGCRRTPDMKKRPRILSPAPGQTYLLTGSANESNQKLLLSAATATDGAYWFVDGLLHASYPSSVPAFWPLKPGTHTITCSDAVGRSSSVVIEVR